MLTRSTAVGEPPPREIGKAEGDSAAFGRQHGVEFIDPIRRAGPVRRHQRHRPGHARELSRYGIDGPAIFGQAQAVLKQGSPIAGCGPSGAA